MGQGEGFDSLGQRNVARYGTIGGSSPSSHTSFVV